MCVQVQACHTAHIWMSEDNFVRSLLSFILGKGIKVQLSGDTGSALPTSHLAGSQSCSLGGNLRCKSVYTDMFYLLTVLFPKYPPFGQPHTFISAAVMDCPDESNIKVYSAFDLRL